jgi:hypothetical protein
MNAHVEIARILEAGFDQSNLEAILEELLANSVSSKVNKLSFESLNPGLYEGFNFVAELSDVKPFVVSDVSHASITALQEWEGYVLSVDKDDFSARLLDITSNAPIEQEIAEFSKSELSVKDLYLLQEGAVFRWIIGNQITRGGQKRRVSQIVFRRLPAWTKSEIDEAWREAKETAEAIEWE